MVTCAAIIIFGWALSLANAYMSNATHDDAFEDPLTKKKMTYIWVNSANWTELEADINDCNPFCSNDITSSQACWSCPPLGVDTTSTLHFTNWLSDSNGPDTPQDRARVDISFTGSAVFVYGVMNNRDDSSVASKGITSSTYLTFLMDGEPVGTPFIHTPNNLMVDGSYWEFNVLVYANTSLGCYGIHNITIMNGGGTHKSAFLFDKIMYTYDGDLVFNTYASYNPPTCPTPGSDASKGYSPASTTIPGYPVGTMTSPGGPTGNSDVTSVFAPFQTGKSGNLENSTGSQSHKGPIAGIAIGVISGVAIIGAFLWLCIRKRDSGGGGNEWYKWEPGISAGAPDSSQRPHPPMRQLNEDGITASLPRLGQDGTPVAQGRRRSSVAQDRRRSGVPTFLRGGSTRTLFPFHRRQSQITPFAVGQGGGRHRALNRIITGNLKSPGSTTSSDTTTVGPSLHFSPNSRYSQDDNFNGTYISTFTNIPAPIPIPGTTNANNPTNNSGSNDSSPTAHFEAQLHALAREVSMLRSEQGNLNQGHNGSLELPPVYEDHHEDDLLSSHTR